MPETDWKQLVKRFDSTGFGKILASFPAQLEQASQLPVPRPLAGHSFENVLACGMGGSGIASRLIRDLYKKQLKIPFVLHSEYGLPEFAGSGSLVFAVSYSGETEETLSAFREAKKRGALVVSIASGGTLAELDAKTVLVPSGLQPRQATAFLFVPQLNCLARAGLIPNPAKELRETIVRLKQQQPSIQRRARELALFFRGRLPVVYGSPLLDGTVYRWQTQFNENAKTLCHSQAVPEMNHNEINALPNTANSFFVLLHESGLEKQLAKRFGFLKKMIGKNGAEETIAGSSPLEQVLAAVHLGDWVSYYSALLNQTDPYPIPLIAELKKFLQ